MKKTKFNLIALVLAASVVMSSTVVSAHAESVVSFETASTAKVSLKDDFYDSINQEWLNSATIPNGEKSTSTFDELDYANDEKIQDILKELLGNKYADGTKEQKIADFYKAVLDTKSRNSQGITPIKKYLESYDNAKNLKDLISADLNTYKETGYIQLLNFGLYTDIKNSSVNIMGHIALSPTLSKEEYLSDKNMASYTKYISTLLVLSGESAANAAKMAKDFIDLEKVLSKAQLEQQEYYDSTKINNIYTIENLNTLYPNIDIKSVISGMGYQIPEKVMIYDKKVFETSAAYFNDQNVELLKSYAKISFLMVFGRTLNEEFVNARDTFNAELYGIDGKKTNEEYAAGITQKYMSDYLGQLYTAKYFSQEAKQDVEAMIQKFISVYKIKILNADWMTDATKQKAIKKLETMTVKIGYPDRWQTTLNNAQIHSFENGGSYFENVCAINKETERKLIQDQAKPVDKSVWFMTTYEVNAYYDFSANELVFPAGILQAPIYSLNAPASQNLGGIGVVIAHEISHAFDNGGSQFDENGNVNNWWTDEDRAAFNERCQKVTKFYDGIEILPGVVSNGELTLAENIADLGGVSCALEVLKQDKNPYYQSFFKAYANMRKYKTSDEYSTYLNAVDVHSNSKIRLNRTVENFEEFYTAFDIHEGDGMYVAPENRVAIW